MKNPIFFKTAIFGDFKVEQIEQLTASFTCKSGARQRFVV
jgi:hypothetical protein